MNWTQPVRVGTGFKPMVSVAPSGVFCLTAQINDKGIYRQVFTPLGQAMTGFDLLIPTKTGQSFGGHWTCYVGDVLNVLYSQESPYRALFHVEIDYMGRQNMPVNVGQILFGDSGAVYNENSMCADSGDLYFALMRYMPDGSKRIELLKNWQHIGVLAGEASPRIAASGGKWFCYARTAPGIADFNYLGEGNHWGTFSTSDINGGMSLAFDGNTALCAFGRDAVRLFSYDFGTKQLNRLPDIASSDIAGGGIAAYNTPNGFRLNWQSKASLKMFAGNATDWQTSVVWSLGGDANTTLEIAGNANDNMAMVAGVASPSRELFVSFKPLESGKDVFEVIYESTKTQGITPLRFYDSRTNGHGKLTKGQSRIVDFGKPDALAVRMNITITDAEAGGYISAVPSNVDDLAIKTSSANWQGGYARQAANFAIVPLFEGKLKLYCNGVPGAAANIILDVSGFEF